MDDGSTEPDQSTMTPAQTVMTIQIIAFALMMGIVSFGVVAFIIGMNKQPGDPFIAGYAAVFAVILTVAAMFVPTRVSASRAVHEAIDRTQQATNNLESAEARERARFAAVYQAKMMFTFALLEGAAWFNLIAYIIAMQWWSFGIAGGLLVMMALSFPTRQRIDSWIQLQLELRQFE